MSFQDSRWAAFRKLCLYYAECVRLEERASIFAYPDQEGKRFIAIDAPLNWRALSSGIKFSMPANPDWGPFLDRIRAKSGLVDLTLGGPLDVFVGRDRKSGENYRVLRPVFVTRVLINPVMGKLEFSATGEVEVNHGWLSGRLKKEEDRQELLELLGLTSRLRRDEDDEERWEVESFEGAVKRLFQLRQDWWHEHVDLRRPSRAPPLSEIGKGGIYNRYLLLEPPDLKYGKRLHRELLRLALRIPDEELDQTALRTLFPHAPPDEAPPPDAPDPSCPLAPAEYQLLNSDQREACAQALVKPLSVVTGPPGTGKSLVVAHALVNQALRGRPALFASRNHQALEAVEPRLNSLTEPRPFVLRPTRPFGEAGRQFDWFRMMTELLANPATAKSDEKRQEAIQKVTAELAARETAEKDMSRLCDLRSELETVEGRIRELAEACPTRWRNHAAADDAPRDTGHLMPIRRIADRLAGPPKGLLRKLWWRLTSQRRKTQATKALAALLQTPGYANLGLSAEDYPPSHPEEVLRLVDALQVFADLAAGLQEERRVRNALNLIPSQEALTNRLEKTKDDLHDATRTAVGAIAASAGANISPAMRELFASLRAGLKNRPKELERMPDESKFAETFRRAAPDLMRHFPLWAVSNLSVERALPLKTCLFDLVLIDEASQCDIPSIVPLLARAKRAVFVGDPNQLSHVTKLPRDTEMRVREAFEVDDFEYERYTFRVNSAFDLASSSQNRDAVTLRSHYRCVGPIADYCNSAFYHGTLIVRTDEEAIRHRLRLGRRARACVWTQVEGEVVPAAHGCYSPAQVDAVERELRRLVGEEFPGTVGVVTPFRAQADKIRDRCHKAFPKSQRSKWQLVIDTVDGFQGDERDLVLLSLVGGPDMPPGSRGFLAGNPNRFNVAVSRARAVLHVLGDRDWATKCQIAYIAVLVRAAEAAEHPSGSIRTDLIGPVWEPRLADVMRRAGLEFEQQYPTCGYYLDFALFSGARKVDVEVDGETYHRSATGDRVLDDHYRDVILKAAGWEVLRFWVYELREDIDGCVQQIRELLEHSS